ncbi:MULTISPECIES: GNAT family N-acetyltransferase [Bacillaceae]|uniref:GNAT family N-acetyltransferase n=1 Tax=Gottfriedia luciferensis TaxID=178774 RepID=A0ABX2ZMZ7_9BACI|nr:MULTISPECIES: GNAT family N-acetyltransferase [Bacillaceae]ODG90115.1 GNAT family N-acetyltransferase [Gottfriedia luciferensis]SFC96307.1 Acetyltransferase (GNAT) family protein [Bacillus sp. UNCCL81]
MEISIRNANQKDYESLLSLFRQVHDLHVFERPDLYKENSTPVDEEEFNNQLKDSKQHILVATLGPVIVGVAVLKVDEIPENSFVNARKILLVNSLCVDDASRKKGIGRKLMQSVLDFAKDLNVDSIELGVSESNQNAIHFYESIGMATKNRKMEFRLS